jgi:hypothetical protein
MSRPKFPTYDRRRDGDVFAWILRAAEETRQRRLRERREDYMRNHTTARPILPIQRPPLEDEH